MIITVGIDPGKTGAIAVLANGRDVLVLEQPQILGKGRAGRYNASHMNRLVSPFAPHPSTAWEEAVDTRIEAVRAAEDAGVEGDIGGALDAMYAEVDKRKAANKRTISLAVIEKQGARPGEGTTSSMTTGRGWGIWLGILAANSIPYEEVAAGVWQKTMRCHTADPAARKAKHIEVANKLFPDIHLLKSHDGKADALLMAVYAFRRYKGKDSG